MSSDIAEIKKITFANSDEDAERRFKDYATKDPLPDVAPALLNSADIRDYVAITGMLFPFHPEPEKGKLKPASYEVDLLGEIIYWDEKGMKKNLSLKKGDSFILPKNSIAFVTPEPTFRLPNYIAIRFNLKITNVHRGILLGTGPLVDPGYKGKLLIPLHNLTNNDYVFVGGEGFIWMEFTKLSPSSNPITISERYERSQQYAEFPKGKKDLGPDQLMAKALKGQEASLIQSAIPIVAESARTSIKEANEMVKRSRTINIALIVSLIGIASGIIIALLIGNRQFINIGQENLRQIEQLKQEVKNQNITINEIRDSLAKAKSGIKPSPSKLPNEKRNQ